MVLQWLALAWAAHAHTLVVFTGARTPSAVESLLSDTDFAQETGSRVQTIRFTDWTAVASIADDAIAAIDATFSASDTDGIEVLCRERGVFHLALSCAETLRPHDWTYCLGPTALQLSASIDAVLLSFGWTEVNVLLDSVDLGLSFQLFNAAQSGVTYHRVGFALTDEDSIGRTVGRSVRLQGNRVSVVLTSSAVTKRIVKEQWNKRIAGAGFANLLTLRSALFPVAEDDVPAIRTGNLILAEEEFASVDSDADYYRQMVKQALALFRGYESPAALSEVLERRLPARCRRPDFVLLNMQSGRRVAVGHLREGALQLTAAVHFLGDSTSVPRNAKCSIAVSANFGARNVDSYNFLPQLYYQGTVIAVQDINESPNLLENFVIELFNFTAGVQQWNYDFAYRNVFPVREQLGLAVLASFSSEVTVNLYKMLKSLNYTGAVVGAINTVRELSSRTAYPQFVRTMLPDTYFLSVYVQSFRHFGWKRCAIFVSNELWGLQIQAGFLYMAEKNGIEVLNNKSMQVLPSPIPSVATLRNCSAQFQHFINTKAKVLIIAVNNNAVLVVDYLYELGLRGGDVQIVGTEWLSLGYIATSDSEVARARGTLLQGAIQFTPVGFVGTVGSKVKVKYSEKVHTEPPLYACFYYDAALAIGYTLDLAIRTGNDYTDPSVFQRFLRGEKFEGCTGPVSFNSETNDRGALQYYLYNAQSADNDTTIATVAPVGVYDPTSTQVFQFFSPVVWSGGDRSPPLDLRQSTVGCPFEDRYNKPFPQGQTLLYCICSALFVAVAALAVWLGTVCWRHPYAELNEQRELQALDVLVYLDLVLEVFQYLALGPSLAFLPFAVRAFLQFTILDLSVFYDFKDGGFEFTLWAVFALCVCAGGMWLVLVFQLDYKCTKVPGCRTLGELSELGAMLASDWLFVPIVYVLTETLVCVRANAVDAPKFSDSFLAADCFLPCWNGRHFWYSLAAGLSLILFIPSALFLRPLWQELFENVNIKTSGRYLLYKSAFQVGLISLKHSLQATDPSLHSYIFLAAVSAYFLFSIRTKAFCYNRTALWQRVSIVVVLWFGALSTAQKAGNTQLLGLMGAGLLAIFATAVIIQFKRMPSLLSQKEGISVDSLLKFAFKRTTVSVVQALRESFYQVGHHSAVTMPERASKDRRLDPEDLNTSRQLPRVETAPDQDIRVFT